MKVLGPLKAHWTAQLCGTDFQEFRSACGVDGLARVDGNELHLLSVIATQPGSGQFRRFIQECKDGYGFIRLWCVMDDALRIVLKRYGFTAGHDVDKYGDMQEVWDWNRS